MGIKLTMKLVKDIDSKQKLKEVSDKEAEDAFRTILSWMGEDPSREGLVETPKRVVKAFKEYFKGYNEDPKKILEKTFGDVEGYDDIYKILIELDERLLWHGWPLIGKLHDPIE